MQTTTLAQMGIDNPDQIVRYETHQKSSRKDVLNIFYKRAKGSLRPVRRTYEFGRASRTSVSDSGAPEYEETFEVSPDYLNAIRELDALLADAGGTGRLATVLGQLDELQRLVDAGEDSAALAARFETLRAELVTLKSLRPG